MLSSRIAGPLFLAGIQLFAAATAFSQAYPGKPVRIITQEAGGGLDGHDWYLGRQIVDTPKPVIARVSGYAIGGGNVICTLCDLTIAAESAQFGQVGPKMGSVETLALKIDESGESWVADGHPLASGDMVKVTYSMKGEAFEIEVPVP